MKRVFISVAVWLSLLAAKAQPANAPYTKRKLAVSEIQLLYATYVQEGIHSAVTGGKGTENLQVYAPGVALTARRDSTAVLSFDGGIDVISSASTDNIDFVVSSASRVDGRGHGQFSANRIWSATGLQLGASAGLSLESDYLSRNLGVRVVKTNSDRSRTVSAEFQAFFDDLRWGRVNPGYYRPVKLIYPAELRNHQWFSHTKRNSFNLNIGVSQVVNRRFILELAASLSGQVGLLSTPFHRVYFADRAGPSVERLPNRRMRIPVSFWIKYALAQRVIVKASPGGYWDSFGIRALSLELEAVYKISPMLSVSVFGRGYGQEKARYFNPFAEHLSAQPYYSSDYDLAKIQTGKVGLGIRYTPYAPVSNSLLWKEIALRYSYYRRSDTLFAHMLTLILNLDFDKGYVNPSK